MESRSDETTDNGAVDFHDLFIHHYLEFELWLHNDVEVQESQMQQLSESVPEDVWHQDSNDDEQVEHER